MPPDNNLRQRVFDQLQKIIVAETNFRPSEISPQTTLTDDLGLDSLDIDEFIIVVEQHFGLIFPDSVLESMRTVYDMVEFIAQQREALQQNSSADES